MSEFRIVPHAVYSPTRCLTCGDHTGPFVDTHVEWPGWGHVYLCCPHEGRPGCIGQIARLCGWSDPLAVEKLQTDIRNALDHIDSLEAELDKERSDKYVSVAEVRELIGRR